MPWNQRCVSLALPSPTCIVWSGTGLNGSICWPGHEVLPRHTFTSHSATSVRPCYQALPFTDFRLRPRTWSQFLRVSYTRLITWTSWPISRSHYPKQPLLSVIASYDSFICYLYLNFLSTNNELIKNPAIESLISYAVSTPFSSGDFSPFPSSLHPLRPITQSSQVKPACICSNYTK